jgi:hypothetical protein
VIQATTKIAGGTWGSPVDLSTPGEEASAPQLAMNPSGHAVAIWRQAGIIKAASRTPQGSWAADGLSAPGGDLGHMDVAIGPAGNAVAIWTALQTSSSDYIIEAATRTPAGQWGPPAKLSEGGNNAWGPRLAIDQAGNVIGTWSRWNDDGDTIIQVTEKEPGEPWSEPEDLSAVGAQAHSAKVAASGARAVVVWNRGQIIEAAVRDANGVWEPPIQISDPESGEPEIAMDGQGNALAVWSSESEDGLTVEVGSLPIGGGLNELVALSAPQLVEAAEPQIAVDPAGRATAVWRAWDGTEPVIEAASGVVGGGWGSPVTISPPGVWSRHAKIAMDSYGNAAAVWKAYDPLTMQAALFDVTTPELRSVSIPPLARAGRPVSFTVSPFDAWSAIGPVSWDFGDAATAAGSSVLHSFKEAGQFRVAVTTTDLAGHSTAASATVSVSPALAVSDRLVPVRSRRAHLKLYCPGTAVCHGSARLARWVKRRNGRKRLRTLGGTEFAIPAEARKTVTIRLGQKGPKLFSGARKNGFTAQLTGDAVESRTVALKPIRPMSNKRRPGRHASGHRR